MRRWIGVLIALGFTTPALAQLPAADHAAKRKAVLDALPGDGIIFVEGTGTPPREDQSFMQSRNFQALTGIMQPNSALVMWKVGEVRGERIVVPPKPAYAWEGDQIGPVEATAITGIPATASNALSALFDTLNSSHANIYVFEQDAGWPGIGTMVTTAGRNATIVRRGPVMRRTATGAPATPPDAAPGATEWSAVSRAISQARARKTNAEIALLQKAAEISVAGHKAAMAMVYPGVNESEIRGVFEGTIFRLGAERVGYPSIVGTGANATYLHYSADTLQSKAGDVVVMDAAAIYRGYSADVTRTFPVSGKFSPEQRIIYEAVLNAQNAAAATVKVGSSMGQAVAAADRELWKGLVKAGLVDSVGATYVAALPPGMPAGVVMRPPTQLSLFYFHGLGHGLGLNVHDPIYSESGAFVLNSIFTLEPGLYVRPNTLSMVPDTPENAAFRARLARVLPKYLGIGTRIEDDYVVTANGSYCQSCGAPRTIAEVEAIAGKSPIRR